MYMYMYTCIYMYICIYVYIYIYDFPNGHEGGHEPCHMQMSHGTCESVMSDANELQGHPGT